MSGIKVYIGGHLYDSEKEPIILVFENDLDRRAVASHLNNMAQKDGVRFYASFPANTMDADRFDRTCQAAEDALGIVRVNHMSDRISEDQKKREIKQILDATNSRGPLGPIGPWPSQVKDDEDPDPIRKG